MRQPGENGRRGGEGENEKEKVGKLDQFYRTRFCQFLRHNDPHQCSFERTNIFKILNSNDVFSSYWKSVILDNKETYYHYFLGEQSMIGSSIDSEFFNFNKDIPDIMQLKYDLIHSYPPYSDNLPVIF